MPKNFPILFYGDFTKLRIFSVYFWQTFVEQLEKLVIGHDNGGEDPGWLLEEVDVDIPVRDEHYKFRCDGWLGGERPGQGKEAVLYPGKYEGKYVQLLFWYPKVLALGE